MAQTVNLTEYVQAMKTVRRFKTLFTLLILLSILFQLNAFILHEFTPALEPAVQAQTDEDAEAPVAAKEAEAPTTASVYQTSLHWAMPITKFAALACASLLVVLLMYAGALSLLGHGSGTSQLISAFGWSVILLGMLIPWQQVYSSSQACGALYSYMDFTQARDLFHIKEGVTFADNAFFYGRFFAYPILAFVVWLIVVCKFAGGYRKLILAETGKPASASL